MVKKIKGIRVAKDLQSKFKFNSEGNSILGNDVASSHEIKGTMDATGSLNLEGDITLQERLSGFLFSPPHIDAAVETAMIQEFINNAASKYEGFMVYITNPAATAPFDLENKFYFCENGTWHASPFIGQITNYAPNLNPLYEISVAASGTDSVPFQLNLPADLFLDADGDYITYSATMVNGDPLPAWLYFDATNTILSGTPTESDVGLLNVLVTATDPSNESGSTTQEIQILAKPVPFWAGATHTFGTSGNASWATVLSNNLLSLDPASGGGDATHTMTTSDEFSIEGSRTIVEFSADHWTDSSAAGNVDNWFMVCLRKAADPNDFVGIYVRDAGGGQDCVKMAIVYQGYAGSNNQWTTKKIKTFTSSQYGDPNEETHVPDLKFRFELGTAIQLPDWPTYYFIPIMIMAMRKNPPQPVIDAGYENFTFEQLRDPVQYAAIPASIKTKYFGRETYSFTQDTAATTLENEFTFNPTITALHNSPSGNNPLIEFDTFSFTADDTPVINPGYTFVNWEIAEGQAFNQSLPTDLFLDPEGETPLTYVATLDDFSALPSWLTFDPATLIFTGTPANSDIGTITVMVRGFDDATEAANNVFARAGNQKLFSLIVS